MAAAYSPPLARIIGSLGELLRALASAWRAAWQAPLAS
jgi:hypothetical protein